MSSMSRLIFGSSPLAAVLQAVHQEYGGEVRVASNGTRRPPPSLADRFGPDGKPRRPAPPLRPTRPGEPPPPPDLAARIQQARRPR
jgi:hypothetical protein